MAILASQNVTRVGIAPAYAAAAAGGDRFTPGSETFLHVKNGSAGALTVTIATPRTDAYGNAIADTAVSVPAAGERMIGPFPAQGYGSVTDGLADITYSGVTSLTIGAFTVA